MLEFVQTTLLIFLMHDHPDGAAIDTKVVFAGMFATKVALSAALGPLLVKTCV